MYYYIVLLYYLIVDKGITLNSKNNLNIFTKITGNWEMGNEMIN